MAKQKTAVARRGPSRGQVVAEKAKAGALARLGRLKDRKEDMTNAGLGLAAGHVAVGFLAKKIATSAAEGTSLMIPKTNISYGKGVGGALALAGVTGMLGSERNNTIGTIAGAMVYAGDRAIETYLAEAANIAAGGGDS